MLSCEQFEILLADHIDGELDSPPRAEDRAAFEQHLGSCSGLRGFGSGRAERASLLLESSADVEPPPALMTKILHATNSGWEFKLRAKGIRGAINRFFAPVLQAALRDGRDDDDDVHHDAEPVRGRAENDPDGGGSGPGAALVVARRPDAPDLGPHDQELRKHAAGLRDPKPDERMETATEPGGRGSGGSAG